MQRLQTADGEAERTASSALKKVDGLQAAIEQVIKGKPEAVRLAIVTLIAGGHLLVEDVPEWAKPRLHMPWRARSIVVPAHSVYFRPAAVRCHRPLGL